MVLFFYFSKTPSPSKKTENEEISTNRKRRLSFCDAAKNRKSNVFLCSASPTPRDPKRMVSSHDFCIGKAHLWLAERAEFRGSHGGAPETGLKGLGSRVKGLGLRV